MDAIKSIAKLTLVTLIVTAFIAEELSTAHAVIRRELEIIV